MYLSGSIVVREALNTDIQSILDSTCVQQVDMRQEHFLGSGISKRVIKGTVSVQVITKNTKNKVLSALKHSDLCSICC